MAVIAHGRSRHTKDFDIWLEPFGSPEAWAEHLTVALREFPESYVWSLAQRRKLEPMEIADEIGDFGVLRIGGLNLPVDVFRKPNEFEPEDFERVWSQSTVMQDGVRLPNAIHLYVTKLNTGREHDLDDIAFLEGRVKAKFRQRLPVCDFAEAKDMLDRFVDPEVLQYGLDNSNADVREHVLALLHEFEAEGDPYSRDILAAWRARQV